MRGPAVLRVIKIAIGLGTGPIAAASCHPATHAGPPAQSLHHAGPACYERHEPAIVLC